MDTPEVDAALALVCNVPSGGRSERRVDVQSVIALATSVTELEDGVALAFPNTNDVAHRPIELRVEAEGALVTPLKDLYIGLARDAGHNA